MARDAPQIDAFGDGGFRLSSGRHKGSLLILRDEPTLWPVRSLAELTPDSFGDVLAAGRAEVEFVLLGVGAVNALPPKPVREALQKAGIGLEFMDTPTAARLYNVLTAEGRKLACALIAI
ncbi:Mth938-like domain-containing protein [Phenylobacterium sp.]|uniref:Mth938-like domain-containing protein n=1 Tax=Phenylobacterium sp. TaxID=1871053 RepID=UPI00286A3E2D|nr:Mth938-like domain-containing protein [Phenylobacterium sp.]